MVTPDQVLVFDMDGVLVDVTDSYRETIRQTVRYFTGREVGNETIQDLKNSGGWTNDWAVAREIIRKLGVEVDYDTVVARFQSIFLGSADDGLMLRERWAARPGLLEDLSRRYRLAVFTGRPRDEALMTLVRFAPLVSFDPVVGAEDVRDGKPAPDGLLEIAAITGVSRIWYVGDTVDDARSARAAGVPFIGIATESNPLRAELKSLFAAENAVAILDDINQLESVL
jgi:HAD superfamily hydrolase (TIGR01548 family)